MSFLATDSDSYTVGRKSKPAVLSRCLLFFKKGLNFVAALCSRKRFTVMKMIAFYNNKGGVGKTSTAINIAYTLSRRQNRILLVDFDGQCNSSRFFTDLANDECGCESAIVNAEEMPLIKSTRYDNIDIVTSSMRMNSISNDFANLSDEEKQTNIIKFRQSDYDYIIVDMPPAMNDFTEHVLTVCDYVYVPIELGTFAVQGLARVTQKIANAGTKYACFASKYDKGNKADRELLEIMKKNLGDKLQIQAEKMKVNCQITT